MTTRIKVGIRLRPFLDSEKQKGYTNQRVSIDEETKEVMLSEDGRRERKTFKFDYVFGADNSQAQVYEASNVDYLLNKVVEGYHCTIFAYGQTGSGKTHTMEGYEYELAPQKDNQNNAAGNAISLLKPRPKQHQDPQRFGIIPRAVSSLFEKLREKEGGEFNVTCSFLQIYNEKIYDLLNPNSIKQSNADGTPVLSQGLRLRWSQREQFQVENLFVFDCKSAEDVMNFFHYGIRNRVTASHKLNMASSRSHTILTLRIESIDLSTQSSSYSKLELVDLAGSERIGQTGTEGKLAKESIDINKSLFILRQVIATLSDIHRIAKQKDSSPQYQHIPYRESKLTSLLKQSIGGNSYCLMLACINPCDAFIDENLSTLNYATKATYIKNEPIRNDDPKNKVIKDLRQDNTRLRFELDKANQHIAFLSQLNNDPSGINPNHPPNCCLPNCQYAGEQSTMNDLSPSQNGRISQVISNQEPKNDLGSLTNQNNNNNSSNNYSNGQQIMNPLSLNNISKLNSSQSTVRESSTNFSSMNPQMMNSSPTGSNPNQNAVAQLQHQSFIQQQQLLQRINTLQLQNQQLQNQNLTRIQGNGDYDNFSDRLIESIAMVRDLLVNNKELRETTDQAIKKSEICEKELFHLQRENQDLRDRMQHLKNGGQMEDFNSTAPFVGGGGTDDENGSLFVNQPLSPSINWKNMQKNDLISEILALRRDKIILERRILGNEIDRSTINGSAPSNSITNPPQNLMRIQNKRIQSNNSPLKQNYNSGNTSQQGPMSLSKKASKNSTAQGNNSSNSTNQQNGTPFQGDSLPTNFGRYTFYQNVSQNNNNNKNNSINFLSDDQQSHSQNRQNASHSLSTNISPSNLMQSFRQTNLQPRPLLQNISPGKKQNAQYFQGQLDDINTPRQNYNINNNHLTNRSNSIKIGQQFQNQIPHHSFSQSRAQNPNNGSFHH